VTVTTDTKVHGELDREYCPGMRTARAQATGKKPVTSLTQEVKAMSSRRQPFPQVGPGLLLSPCVGSHEHKELCAQTLSPMWVLSTMASGLG
jgi:hypothetical protein